MRMVMDMSTGKIIEDEFGAYEDEVLNAEWTPPSAELSLGMHETRLRPGLRPEIDADDFLATMYRSQQ